jgi:hypothetical protein
MSAPPHPPGRSDEKYRLSPILGDVGTLVVARRGSDGAHCVDDWTEFKGVDHSENSCAETKGTEARLSSTTAKAVNRLVVLDMTFSFG